jgi:hypothetical protein
MVTSLGYLKTYLGKIFSRFCLNRPLVQWIAEVDFLMTPQTWGRKLHVLLDEFGLKFHFLMTPQIGDITIIVI